MYSIKELLRFYFITDDAAAGITPLEQVRVAIDAGATLVQYRNKRFGLHFFHEVEAVRDLCHQRGIPLIINDNVLLAKAVGADGVHLGQDDDPPRLARAVMGPQAIIGLSVSTLEELSHSQLEGCDYLGSGPVFATGTKKDAKPVIALDGLKAVVARAGVPVVAVGGITAENARSCFEHGADGVAVISGLTRAQDPAGAAAALSAACRL
ncbi:MAG: thiamine phosphate synthase [Desulfosarcinaceae bacterium]